MVAYGPISGAHILSDKKSIKRSLRSITDRVLLRSPLQTWLRVRSSKQLAVLAYHGIFDSSQFARQMEYIAKNMSPVGIFEVLDAFDGRMELPRHAVLVTLDDGYASWVDNGISVLAKKQIPAIAFVTSGNVGSYAPYWFEEVPELIAAGGTCAQVRYSASGYEAVECLKQVKDRERREAIKELRSSAELRVSGIPKLSVDGLKQLYDAGIEVGNHSFSHPILPMCSIEEMECEVEKAHCFLSDVVGSEPVVFSYPNGDHDPRAKNVLKRLGYRAAFLFNHCLQAVPPLDHFAVSRIRVNSNTSIARLAISLSGLHPGILRLRRSMGLGMRT